MKMLTSVALTFLSCILPGIAAPLKATTNRNGTEEIVILPADERAAMFFEGPPVVPVYNSSDPFNRREIKADAILPIILPVAEQDAVKSSQIKPQASPFDETRPVIKDFDKQTAQVSSTIFVFTATPSSPPPKPTTSLSYECKLWQNYIHPGKNWDVPYDPPMSAGGVEVVAPMAPEGCPSPND